MTTLHLDDFLDISGGEISLYTGSLNIVDQVNYPITVPDIAFARIDNGSEWSYMDPTPNMSNSIELTNKGEDFQPKVFELFQNYPNPFNPFTQINYNLLNRSLVVLEVYDIMGRKIKTLVNENQSVGSYKIDWDSTNNYGDFVSAGVYVYTIKIGEYIQTKKMILLK